MAFIIIDVDIVGGIYGITLQPIKTEMIEST